MKKQAKLEKRAALTQEMQRVAEQLGMDAQDGHDLLAYLTCTEGMTEWAAIDTLLRRGKESVPALLAGLVSPNGKTRATCALLLDHVADDCCIEPLRRAIFTDPLEAVRRCALHALICDGCKECPLTTDVVDVLIQVAANDRSVAVRRRAVFYLSMQRPDPRIAPFLESLLSMDIDTVLQRRAENAIRQHQT